MRSYLGPGWLLAYTVGACLWMLAVSVTPIPLVIATACGGAAGIIALGNLISGGHVVPPEDRR